MQEPKPMQVQVPVLELANVNVAVGQVPNRPELKQLIIGPIMLSMPLDANARKVLIKGLTGVEIAIGGEGKLQ